MKIGLTYTGSEEKHSNYITWLKREGIEVVTLSAEDNNLDALGTCDGLVMSGGNDVHPKFYRNSRIDYPNVCELDEQRDTFEIGVFESALKKNMPVLGVCRGLQLINCILGGDLKQDLGALNKTHKGDPDKRHGITITPGTLLATITGINQGEINSAHHQAIDKLGEGLIVNCLAEDGTIEGIEGSKAGGPFLLAVQWHPERMFTFRLQDSPLSKNIRDNFIQAIRK